MASTSASLAVSTMPAGAGKMFCLGSTSAAISRWHPRLASHACCPGGTQAASGHRTPACFGDRAGHPPNVSATHRCWRSRSAGARAQQWSPSGSRGRPAPARIRSPQATAVSEPHARLGCSPLSSYRSMCERKMPNPSGNAGPRPHPPCAVNHPPCAANAVNASCPTQAAMLAHKTPHPPPPTLRSA